MSELKAKGVDDVYIEYFNTGKHELAQIYLKSEADKVIADLEESHKKEVEQLLMEIAELKNKINEAQTELELWRDGSIISEAHQKELDEKLHSDYKRCLAMAKMCEEAYNRECCLNPEEMTNKEFYKQQIEFWPRWSSKWLAIAEKFKEAK